MKKLSLLLIILFSLNVIGQKKIEIEIDNPEPIVGESVTFSLNADFLTDNLKKGLGNDIELTRSTSISGMQSDNFERVIIFNKVGFNKVGPFEFEFNGQKYVSNQIEINVQPKIVLEESLEIRIAKLKEIKYIIIEQLVKNVAKTEANEFGNITTYLGGVTPENFEFATIQENLGKKIELDDRNTSSETLNSENPKLGEIGFTHSIIRYRINFDEDFKGEYKLTEKDFTNLPKNYKLKQLILKK